MMDNHLPPLEEWYSNRSYDSGHRGTTLPRRYGSVIECTPTNYFEKFKADAALLKETMSPSPTTPSSGTLAEQVFGSQARQQRISLKHLTNVLHERAVLHRRQLDDIDRRLTDCQDRLSVLKMHLPLDGGKGQQHLEKLIIELEKQRHAEELSFWKDSAEIRQQLFESAATYSAAQRRKDMLYGVEADGI